MFKDRSQAGQELAAQMHEFRGERHLLVVGLPKGGVVVAEAVAEELNAPLDVVIIKKLILSGEEVPFGAIAEDGVVSFLPWASANALSSPCAGEAIDHARDEIHRLRGHYRTEHPAPDYKGKTVCIVDDGAISGASMEAAAEFVRRHEPRKIIVALPVCSRAAFGRIRRAADTIVLGETPQDFSKLAERYDDFTEVNEESALRILRESREKYPAFPLPRTFPKSVPAGVARFL